MDYTTLGNTGLRVSRMGLGCGGPSQLGLHGGGSAAEAEAVVHRALELGVNYFDTAETYRTEVLLGRALKAAPREGIVVASKKAAADRDDNPVSGDEFLAGIDRSLSRLGLEYIDVYQVHALTLPEYDHAIAEIVPAMLRARETGKIRHIGVTEMFIPDPGHAMLSRALGEEDPPWEAVMTGFNMLNPSARERVFPLTQKKGIGALIMFAGRFRRPRNCASCSTISKRRDFLRQMLFPRRIRWGFFSGRAPRRVCRRRGIASAGMSRVRTLSWLVPAALGTSRRMRVRFWHRHCLKRR